MYYPPPHISEAIVVIPITIYNNNIIAPQYVRVKVLGQVKVRLQCWTSWGQQVLHQGNLRNTLHKGKKAHKQGIHTDLETHDIYHHKFKQGISGSI